MSDIEESLKSLTEKLNWIIQRLDFLEALLMENKEYPEVVSFLRSIRFGTTLYGEPLKTLERLVSAKNLMESIAHKDEIAKIIINHIALKGPRNISQLTREVKNQRGKASRTTIRKKVQSLMQSKILVKEGQNYQLTN